MRVALYHRVSTVDQDPTAARHELPAAARGYTIAMEVEETGSGARNDRPGLQQVMAAARAASIGGGMVWKLAWTRNGLTRQASSSSWSSPPSRLSSAISSASALSSGSPAPAALAGASAGARASTSTRAASPRYAPAGSPGRRSPRPTAAALLPPGVPGRTKKGPRNGALKPASRRGAPGLVGNLRFFARTTDTPHDCWPATLSKSASQRSTDRRYYMYRGKLSGMTRCSGMSIRRVLSSRTSPSLATRCVTASTVPTRSSPTSLLT